MITRAAFYPPLDTVEHPILPNGVDELTMFADYRVCLFFLLLVVLAPTFYKTSYQFVLIVCYFE